MKRNIILFTLLIISSIVTWADEPIRFTASAPPSVILDRPFQLVYNVNATAKDLRVPDILNFDVLAGPFESHSSSIQMINGKTTSSVSVSYTYTLQAQKTGTFTISSASIMVGGQKYTSNGLAIKVLPADSSSPSNTQGGSASTSGTSISNDNVFIRASASKTNVYEQEAILVTYKLYTLQDVVQCVNKKMPDFNGFMKQDIEQSQNKQFSYENYNGRNYGTVVLYQVLLYPQHAGEIIIDKAVFEAAIRIQNKTATRSIFDDFFDSYTNVNKRLTVQGIKINVKSLPGNKPTSFNGTVGRFTLNSSITSNDVKSNDAVTIKVNINGTGNMKLIQNPDIKFPEGFEVYDPKVNNNFKTTSSGISGTKSIEYLFIPRHAGKYEIPSAEFTYFDTHDNRYKTLRTPPYKLNVLKGDNSDNSTVVGNYIDKEDVKLLGKDIRYIQTDEIRLTHDQNVIFGTFKGWMLFLIPTLLSFLLFFFFRKQMKDNADIQLMKNRKANKIARKRLKLAQKLLEQGNKDKFYEEVLKSVWSYLSDKLAIPVSELTKEKVVTELGIHKIEEKVVQEFIDILNTCEFARYAPNTGQQEMGNLYDVTIETISKLEELIRKSQLK